MITTGSAGSTSLIWRRQRSPAVPGMSRSSSTRSIPPRLSRTVAMAALPSEAVSTL